MKEILAKYLTFQIHTVFGIENVESYSPVSNHLFSSMILSKQSSK